MSFLAKGPQIGSVVRDGKTVCDNYEWYCMRHNNPVKMLKSISESIEKVGERPHTMKKKLIISGAHCNRCGQWVEEGRWYED